MFSKAYLMLKWMLELPWAVIQWNWTIQSLIYTPGADQKMSIVACNASVCVFCFVHKLSYDNNAHNDINQDLNALTFSSLSGEQDHPVSFTHEWDERDRCIVSR